MTQSIYTDAGRIDLDDALRLATETSPDGLALPPRPYTAKENAAADARVAASTTETTRVSLEDVVAAAVRKGGTLPTIIGATTDTAGVTSLRAMNKLTKAQIAADPAAVLVKLLPMLRDLAIVERQSGKLIVRLYDESN